MSQEYKYKYPHKGDDDDDDKHKIWTPENPHMENSLQENHVDKDPSLAWLAAGDLYTGREGFAVAIQDRVIKTTNYEKHCLGVLSDRHMHKI